MPYGYGYRRRGGHGSHRRRKSRSNALAHRIPMLRHLYPFRLYMKLSFETTLYLYSSTYRYQVLNCYIQSLKDPFNISGGAYSGYYPNGALYGAFAYLKWIVHASKLTLKLSATPYSTQLLGGPNQTYGLMMFPNSPGIASPDTNEQYWEGITGSVFVQNRDISNRDITLSAYHKTSDVMAQDHTVFLADAGNHGLFGSTPFTVSSWTDPTNQPFYYIFVLNQNATAASTLNCVLNMRLEQWVEFRGPRYDDFEDLIFSVASSADPDAKRLFKASQTIEGRTEVQPLDMDALLGLPAEPTYDHDTAELNSLSVPFSRMAELSRDANAAQIAFANGLRLQDTLTKENNRVADAMLRGGMPSVGPFSDVSSSIEVDD